jgi:peptidyl-prolyl cis-trans isomerase SDCCAG10
MASIEPQTTAKVILHSTKGPIEIELWAKEIPLASRNFIQLCLNGYYNGCQFHRVVKDFVVQSGDPTNTGYGGTAIYEGESFEDEFHSRLRFSRRGIVACANAGTKNSNGSQFIITLAPTPELNGRNSIFGRVVGDTIFNVLKIGEAEVGDDERPLYPVTITHTEVVIPYFDNLDTSHGPSKVTKRGEVDTTVKSREKRKARVKLMYDDDESSDDDIPFKKFKIKTATDVVVVDSKESQDRDDQKPKAPLPSITSKSFGVTQDEKIPQAASHKVKAKKGSRDRERETLALLEAFKSKIATTSVTAGEEEGPDSRPIGERWNEDEEIPSDYEDDEEPDVFEGLSGHVFRYSDSRPADKDDSLVIIDSRKSK